MRKSSIQPGRGQSGIGLVVGIIFVIIGFCIIPSVGAFGVLWTGLAIVITIIHGINTFAEDGEGIPMYEIYTEDDTEQPNYNYKKTDYTKQPGYKYGKPDSVNQSDDKNEKTDYTKQPGYKYGKKENAISTEMDIEEKFKKLSSLKEKGLITEEEYEQKRKELLEKF